MSNQQYRMYRGNNGNRGRGAGRGWVQPGGSTTLSLAAKEELLKLNKYAEEAKTSAQVLKLQLAQHVESRGTNNSGLDITWVDSLISMIAKIQFLQTLSKQRKTQSFRKEARHIGKILRRLDSPEKLVNETSSDSEEVKQGIGRAIVSLVEAYRKWRKDFTTWRKSYDNYVEAEGDQEATSAQVEDWYDGLSADDCVKYGKTHEGVDQTPEDVASFDDSEGVDSRAEIGTKTAGTGQTSRRPSTGSQQSAMTTATYGGQAPGGGVSLGSGDSVVTFGVGAPEDGTCSLLFNKFDMEAVMKTTVPGTADASHASTSGKEGVIEQDHESEHLSEEYLSDSDDESGIRGGARL
ncbi:hypothetical protein QFC22_003722 [Naganishia vaughanmartiniae]|uniref:Uncharacterized protein n=1 Tax=Naganishia vaughanmartiniae TaxID=1424756 RepID=A0ACC2X5C8_9TREE|nr:hypothetical protein QFC22_003722 [Naganishia vaughanmartiniae]